MARVHSKHTVILIDGHDISGFCTDSNCEESSGTEDVTTYGKNKVVKDPTLGDGAFGCSGKYDSAAAGPRAVLKPLVGTKVNIKYRPEGTGAGLPQDSFDAVITKYTETAPVAGYRLWTLETEPSDEWDSADQA
ncbi:hypothetical protein AB0M02_44240 [Actinoplanes sp. NPDC051861]|uniref:hypothetical protein n=1 Tax=Actinoplanes sp. NPDC051861 TaxID=3155170 RepID=UPI00341BD422